MLSSSKEMAEVQKVLIELLGLPNESYQSLTIHMKVGDCIRVEAEFIAKGKEWNGEVLDSGHRD